VVQRRSSLCFALEAAESLCVVGKIIGKELEGNVATELQVLGFVNYTHAPATKLLDDAIVRDGLADHAQECYGGSVDKSMKSVDLAASQEDYWRKIAITLTMLSEPDNALFFERILIPFST
jgi:hypothetical protein